MHYMFRDDTIWYCDKDQKQQEIRIPGEKICKIENGGDNLRIVTDKCSRIFFSYRDTKRSRLVKFDDTEVTIVNRDNCKAYETTVTREDLNLLITDFLKNGNVIYTKSGEGVLIDTILIQR